MQVYFVGLHQFDIYGTIDHSLWAPPLIPRSYRLCVFQVKLENSMASDVVCYADRLRPPIG